MKNALSHLLVGFLWLLHWLPLPALRGVGWILGKTLYALGRERRSVALINLRLCFPEKTEAEREALARQHFIAFSRAVLDRTLGWWASKERLQRMIRVKGEEHLVVPEDTSLIVLSPHFVGLDAAATRLTMLSAGCTVYSKQKNPVFDKLLFDGRHRFQRCLLPDMDFRSRDSIFVPFFGVQAATIPGVSRLARLTGAKVVACITRQVADGYEVEVTPAWDNFPGESVEADTEMVNRFIESQVLRMPEQYFWLHKRFKTRPPGEQRFYK